MSGNVCSKRTMVDYMIKKIDEVFTFVTCYVKSQFASVILRLVGV